VLKQPKYTGNTGRKSGERHIRTAQQTKHTHTHSKHIHTRLWLPVACITSGVVTPKTVALRDNLISFDCTCHEFLLNPSPIVFADKPDHTLTHTHSHTYILTYTHTHKHTHTQRGM